MEGLGKIGVDFGALAFYIVNIGVILFILAKFVYKPLLGFIDERRHTVEDSLNQAEKLRSEFAAEVKKREDEKKEAVESLKKELAATRSHAEDEAKLLIAAAQKERDRIIEQARAQVDAMQRDLEHRAEEDMLERITKVVTAAVKQNVSGDQASVIVRKLWKEQESKRS